jgi:hypothetical protein
VREKQRERIDRDPENVRAEFKIHKSACRAIVGHGIDLILSLFDQIFLLNERYFSLSQNMFRIRQ